MRLLINNLIILIVKAAETFISVHETVHGTLERIMYLKRVNIGTIDLLLIGNNDGCLGSFLVLVPCHVQSKQELGILQQKHFVSAYEVVTIK